MRNLPTSDFCVALYLPGRYPLVIDSFFSIYNLLALGQFLGPDLLGTICQKGTCLTQTLSQYSGNAEQNLPPAPWKRDQAPQN